MSGLSITTPLAFIGGLGPWEVIAIAVVALLLFGKRLPQVAKSAGKAVVQFKKGLREVEEDIESDTDEEDTATGEPPKTEESAPDETRKK